MPNIFKVGEWVRIVSNPDLKRISNYKIEYPFRMKSSWGKTSKIKVILNISSEYDSEVTTTAYELENDWIYLPEWLEKIEEEIKNGEIFFKFDIGDIVKVVNITPRVKRNPKKLKVIERGSNLNSDKIYKLNDMWQYFEDNIVLYYNTPDILETRKEIIVPQISIMNKKICDRRKLLRGIDLTMVNLTMEE